MGQTKSKNKIDITLGSLVVLKAHPYSLLPTQNNNYPKIEDYPIVDSPIMVVGEIIKNFQKIHDENTGEKKLGKNSIQCKCFWFNHKSGSFEETWLPSRMLSVIIDCSVGEEEEDDEIDLNNIISLKSINLEKTKMSRLYETRSQERFSEIYKSIGIHEYEPPVMQVIETKKTNLDDKYDIKTGKPKKFSTRKLVKCKWFNTFLNKFSEFWLPSEVLLRRPKIDSEHLQSLNNCILGRKVIRTSKLLLMPSGLSSDGFYQKVEGVNLLTGLFVSRSIHELNGMEINENEKVFTEYLNVNKLLKESEDKKKFDQNFKFLKKRINNYKKRNCAIRVLYKNLKGEFSRRVLTDYVIRNQLLEAFCQLKQDKRRFNLLSIHSLECVWFEYKTH